MFCSVVALSLRLVLLCQFRLGRGRQDRESTSSPCSHNENLLVKWLSQREGRLLNARESFQLGEEWAGATLTR